jgi:DNA-binding Xre family transcriptional regulator
MVNIFPKEELMGAKFYKLFDILNRRGISQKELASAIGAQENTISALKRKPEQDFKVSTLVKICQFLEVSMDEIMEIEDDFKARQEETQNKSHQKA